ncbi:hypothetical protein [Nonomuraea sp. NPDC049695]|uniref:hypothetical protein n=1 Tax=Nonomuraea sp. NPDC049695 TaxID=3154734 RepID=UPI00343EE9F5
MDLALWIAAGLLAVVALVGGISKTFLPKEKLAAAWWRVDTKRQRRIRQDPGRADLQAPSLSAVSLRPGAAVAWLRKV